MLLQQIIVRKRDDRTSSTARMEAQLQRITRALERDGRLSSSRESDRSLSSSHDDDGLASNSEVHRETEVISIY
jgi:hypothetical protein